MNSLNGTGDDIKKMFMGKYNEEICRKIIRGILLESIICTKCVRKWG